jgi:hypothetical protein
MNDRSRFDERLDGPRKNRVAKFLLNTVFISFPGSPFDGMARTLYIVGMEITEHFHVRIL